MILTILVDVACFRQEVKQILKASYMKALLLTPTFTSSKVVAYVTFLTFVLLGNELNAEVVFVSLSLFAPIRVVMTYWFPLGVMFGSESTVTISRIEVSWMLTSIKSRDIMTGAIQLLTCFVVILCCLSINLVKIAMLAISGIQEFLYVEH